MNNTQNDDRRFIYFYFNRNEPEKIRQIVPAHVQYWEAANRKGYMGGPFADHTGGLISFVASSLQEAAEIILQDPFVLEDLIDQKWIKEWLLEAPIRVSRRKSCFAS
jgi:uncharacterized protein YciI